MSPRLQELKEEFEKSGGGFEKFRIGELFDIHPTKSYGLTNSKLFASKGNTPVVVNSSINNGVGGYVDLPPTEKANTITFSDTTSADSIFLQDEDFIGYSHVQGLYPREENKWTSLSLLYFVAVFRHVARQYQFDYAYKFNRKIAMNMAVLLPTTEKELAFSYMEQYIREVEAELVREAEDESAREVEAYLAVSGFSGCELTEEERAALEHKPSFEEFRIGELFDIRKGVRLTKSNMMPGAIRFVGSSSENNGITHLIGNDSHLHSGNAITVCYNGSVGETFYQDEMFWASDDVNVLYFKHNEINEAISLYFVALIKKLKSKYGYSFKWTREKMKDDAILVPVANGEIDFAYMQAYISAVKKLVIADVVKWKERELAAMRNLADSSQPPAARF